MPLDIIFEVFPLLFSGKDSEYKSSARSSDIWLVTFDMNYVYTAEHSQAGNKISLEISLNLDHKDQIVRWNGAADSSQARNNVHLTSFTVHHTTCGTHICSGFMIIVVDTNRTPPYRIHFN